MDGDHATVSDITIQNEFFPDEDDDEELDALGRDIDLNIQRQNPLSSAQPMSSLSSLRASQINRNIPSDVIGHIISFLPVKDLCAFLASCRFFFSVSTLPHVWPLLYQQRFDPFSHQLAVKNRISETDAGDCIDWRLSYSQRSHAEANWTTAHYNLRHFEGHEGAVTSLHLLKTNDLVPSAQFCLSSGQDSLIRLWDLDAGRTVGVMRGHKNVVWHVESLEDHLQAVSVSGDGSLKLWSLESLETITTCVSPFTASGEFFWRLSPLSSSVIAAASNLGPIRLFDLRSGKLERSLIGPKESTFSIHAMANGERIVSGGTDRTLRIWDSGSGLCMSSVESAHYRPIFSVYCCNSSTERDGIIVSGSGDKSAKRWTAEGKHIDTLGGHGDSVWAVTGDAFATVTAGVDKKVCVYDSTTGHMMQLFDRVSSEPIFAASMCATSMVTGGGDGMVLFWDFLPEDESEIDPAHDPMGWRTMRWKTVEEVEEEEELIRLEREAMKRGPEGAQYKNMINAKRQRLPSVQ